jgi:hypothetical protein
MTTIKYVAPWLAAAAIGGAIALAPAASADIYSPAPPPAPSGGANTSPLVPYGSNPYVPYGLGVYQGVYEDTSSLDLPS